MKRDKGFIPESLRHENMKNKYLFTNEFIFQDETMLATYKPKKRKCLTVLSTMHSTKNNEKENKSKTDAKCYSSLTKGGVDSMDHMAKQYTCKRKTGVGL
ncbi:PiggyBac transposable element-derived protein 4 [Plakobranchus ocellatus]|uniref:PiggyBac transposable element-derived protein 4 n=1 Tax=Plakobranchus ocellatus TaxID=259542 RepID=A0AAV3Y9L8_9GAST|nr:PiggyBac transposable element-derived protein 4 [Plakobranchus ocellatus]